MFRSGFPGPGKSSLTSPTTTAVGLLEKSLQTAAIVYD